MKRFFKRLGIFVENKHLIIFIIGLAFLIPSVFGAMLVEMKTGNETFVSGDSQVSKDFDRFNQDFSSDVIIILLSVEDFDQLLQPDNVASMEYLEDRMNQDPQVVSTIGPAFFIKQALVGQGGSPELPDNLAQIRDIVIDETGEIRDDFIQVFPDKEHAFIAVTLDGTLSRDEQKDVIEEIEDTIEAAGFQGIDSIVTGTPVLLSGMMDALGTSMIKMLLLSVVLMLLVLAVIFIVRGFFAWRWLPLGVVLIAIVYAFGAMGILSIPITMVTMAAFPILIGLGVDYAIQFHNRYDEEARKGETVADAIIDSVAHIGPTIGIAIIAACLGFAALFFSPVPMIQDFGLTLIIGVVASYLLSMFFLLAILYWHDRRNGSKAESDNGNKNSEKEGVHIVDRILRRLATWVIKNPAVILPIALILCAAGLIADGHIETETNQMKYMSSSLSIVTDLEEAEDVLGGVHSMNIFLETDEDVTDPAVLSWIAELEQRIAEEQSECIVGSDSIAGMVIMSTGGTIPSDTETIEGILEAMPVPIKSNLINDEHTSANITIHMKDLTVGEMEELEEQLEVYAASPPEGMEVTVTGTSIFMIELLDALSSGRMEMTLIGIAMVFAGLFLLFKFRILRALIAILPIGLILGWSGGMMYVMGIKYTPITATLGALIIGIGVEFTILLMMRYYEERDKNEGVVEAMTTAMTKIGRAVIASGFTVIGGFGALLVATDFPIIQDFGVVTLINVFFALVSTLLVLPTLIVLIDRRHERRKARKNSESVS